MSTTMFRATCVAVTACAVLGAGCGSYVREGRGPMQAVLTTLEGASGVSPDKFGGTLSSDVLTFVKKDQNGVQVSVATIYGDVARASVDVTLKNPGTSESPTQPSTINEVTFSRYRITYERSDGRNTPGVDVPYSFDSAVTFSVKQGTTGAAGFDLVRITAKQEAPLAALASNSTFITTIATVTLYGQDRAGNEVIATGKIGVTFGNFGDPE